MESKTYKLAEITKLDPAFDGQIGWLSLTELNLIDPDATRFDVIDEMIFEDNSVFVKVVYA